MGELLKTINRGIESATYNKEAEVAREAAVVKAKEARESLRKKLFEYRDIKLEMQKHNSGTKYFNTRIVNLIDNGFKYLTDNPNAKADEIKEKEDSTETDARGIIYSNYYITKAEFLRKYIPAMADADFANKKITSAQKSELDKLGEEFGKYADSVNANPFKYTPQDLISQLEKIYNTASILQSEIYKNKGVSITPDPNEKQLAELFATAETAKKAEASKFDTGRMVKRVLGVAGTTVGALLLFVFILLGGMLASNDVIGRPVAYRILYFIYGGLFFPFVLLYYLYRWFRGTAPNIYRLLPIFKTPAESSMGRFFLFPFTYTEDKAAIDAHIEFMSKAATIVGKKFNYTPGVDSVLSKVSEGIKDLTVGTVAAASAVAETTKEVPVKVSEEAGRILEALSNINVKPKS